MYDFYRSSQRQFEDEWRLQTYNFVYWKLAQVYTWFGRRRGEHVWCIELFYQPADCRVNKRKLYTNNAVKDNGKYFG